MEPHEHSFICVTGATGYIAVFIVRDLLAENYRVRATVRSLANQTKIQPLRALDPSSTNLEIVELDLNDSSTFKPALSGCDALIHTATPIFRGDDGRRIFTSVEEAEEKQLKPAVKGTEDLLRVAADSGICKVVLTSSGLAMVLSRVRPPILSESYWTDTDEARANITKQPLAAYGLAKTLQESVAWELSAELGFRLVSINPVLVIGPSLTPHKNTGQDVLIELCHGVQNPSMAGGPRTISDAYLRFVDVRDVARAHVLALTEAAEGRYLLATANVHYEDILKILAEVDERFRKTGVSSISEEERKAVPSSFDNSKAKAFGVCTIPWEQTIRDAGFSIIENGHWPEHGG